MNYIHTQDDFSTEPVRGLPAALPRGEFILWQGAPAWRAFASQVFKTHILAALIALAAALRAGLALAGGTGLSTATGEAIVILLFGLIGLAILYLLAWLVERTTVYTITNKRIMMRIGVAIQKTFNIPFAALDGGALKANRDGTGNVSAILKPGTSLDHLILWPHVRPWKLTHTQPTLRAIPKADSVARLLANAFTAHLGAEQAAASALQANKPTALASADQSLGPHDQPPPLPSNSGSGSHSGSGSGSGSGQGPGVNRDPHHIPKPLILMAASLAVVTLIMVGIVQLGDLHTGERPPVARVTFSLDLTFERAEDGSITIVETETRRFVAHVPAQTETLLHAAFTAFQAHRFRNEHPQEAPFQLQWHHDDGVYLADALTGEHMRLSSYGPMQNGATAQLIDLARSGAVSSL